MRLIACMLPLLVLSACGGADTNANKPVDLALAPASEGGRSGLAENTATDGTTTLKLAVAEAHWSEFFKHIEIKFNATGPAPANGQSPGDRDVTIWIPIKDRAAGLSAEDIDYVSYHFHGFNKGESISLTRSLEKAGLSGLQGGAKAGDAVKFTVDVALGEGMDKGTDYRIHLVVDTTLGKDD